MNHSSLPSSTPDPTLCAVRRTLKSGLTPEEAQALGLSSGSEMQV